MKLSYCSIKENRTEWEQKGYLLPQYDFEELKDKTSRAPEWVHFGAGNIFRAFIASILQDMLNDGKADTGIIVAEGYDYEIIDKAYRPYDNLSLAVTLCSEGNIEKTVLASVTESLRMAPGEKDYDRLKQVFTEPGLKLASFTITEKGYNLKDRNGSFFPAVEADFNAGPEGASSYLGKLAALLYTRYMSGKLPICLASMDNCSHNGSRLNQAMVTFASMWVKNGLVEAGFEEYVNDREKVGFPWTMIDKITPRPDAKVIRILERDGFENAEAVKTEKGTFVAPFVNAEETQYLVLENWFPNGRPPIEGARGVTFADRDTVDKVERMKVCTCLNPLHTALAVYGCLLGYTLISEEMKDPELKKMVERIGYVEGLPVVVDPGVLVPKDFLNTCLTVRFPNVFMPDTPQRIATDTSQKLSIRYGETVKSYLERGLDIKTLKLIPLVYAGWLRYLLGVDDNGNVFELSDDPMLDEMHELLFGISLGWNGNVHERLKPILSNAVIFGVDLYKAGLAELTERYFAELITEIGAVRATLKKYVHDGSEN